MEERRRGTGERKSDNISTGYGPRNARSYTYTPKHRSRASSWAAAGPKNNAPCLLRDCGYIRSGARSYIYGVSRGD